MLEANSQFPFLNELWPNVLQKTRDQMFDKSLVVDQRSVTVSELAAGSTNEIHVNMWNV